MNIIYLRSLILFVAISFCSAAFGSKDAHSLKKMTWPFEGTLGKVDRQAAQRGFQVYKEVCAACHGLYNLSYRN